MRDFLSKWRNQPVAAAFVDRDLDDDLLHHLVGSVFTLRSSLGPAIAMSLLILAGAYGATGEPLLLALVVGQGLVGLGRVSVERRFARRDPRRINRGELLAIDRSSLFWSAAQALVLGVGLCVLETPRIAAAGLPITFGAAFGCCIAYTTRSAGRMRLLAAQTAGIVGPVVFGLVAFRLPHGPIYATLFSGFAICTLFIGLNVRRRLIEHFRINEANRRMAQLDMLTGLHNRFSFNAALDSALQRKTPLALMSIDLDRFKQINDSAGHLVGDQVLKETAKRLTACGDEFVARLGGDEFMLIVERTGGDPREVEALARRIVRAMAEPFALAGGPIAVGCSLGFALFPEHAETSDDLLKRSDFALYEAKSAGRGVARMFETAMQTRFANERRLELALDEALRREEIEPWFQPVIDIRSGRIVGYEALARWNHPDLGYIPPDRFVAIAERTGAIGRIGRIMTRKSCLVASKWPAGLNLSINVSPQEFRNPEALVRGVLDALEQSRFPPSNLFLEITESELLSNTIPARAAMQRLREAGVRFALDDFGAGYCSLAYVQDYPFARIKLDRKFIEQLDQGPTSSAIIASVCALAERLNLEVVAEGVETRTQHQALQAMGVPLAQGYLYGRPAPADLMRLSLMRAAAA